MSIVKTAPANPKKVEDGESQPQDEASRQREKEERAKLRERFEKEQEAKNKEAREQAERGYPPPPEGYEDVKYDTERDAFVAKRGRKQRVYVQKRNQWVDCDEYDTSKPGTSMEPRRGLLTLFRTASDTRATTNHP